LLPLAVRLYNATTDAGMKDMLTYLIARDTMHQNQWLAAIEDMGGAANLPIPNSFPQTAENQQFNYSFFASSVDGSIPPEATWNTGPSIDGKGTLSVFKNAPMGDEPVLGPARPDSGAQTEQMA
jgi:Mn-containing catalase